MAPLTWVGAGPAGPQQARTQAGALQYPGLSNSVPNRVLIRAGNGPSSVFVFGTADTTDAYPPITSGTVYFSFVLRVTDLTGFDTGNYFAGFTPDQAASATTPANVFTRVLLRPSGAGYNIGLVKSSPVVANFTWDTTVFAVGDTVLLVGAYAFSGENADISYLWINPDPTTFCSTTPPAPTLVNSAGVDATSLASVAYMQRPLPAQPSALLTDELRVALFWDGVVRPGWDYADAPGSYHTLYADNGARHTVVPGTYMGERIDVECNGLPTPLAVGDDADNSDDGDGVAGLPGSWEIGGYKEINVIASVAGKLDAFFDWDKSTHFEMDEKVFDSVDLVAGPNPLTVAIPSDAVAGFTYARFRFSTAGGLGPAGAAPNGEVEDYRVNVVLPPIVPFNGLQHEALGGAQLNIASNLLSITPTGATGGVKITLGESDGFAADFTGLDGLQAANASVQFAAYGHLNGNTNSQLLSSLRIDGQGSNATLSVDFSGLGATGYGAFFYDRDGRLQRVENIPPGTSLSLFTCPLGSVRVRSMRFVNGHWILDHECVRFLADNLVGDIRIVELVPWLEQYEHLINEIQIMVAGLPNPVQLNDAVYKGGVLYSARGDSRLQVTGSEVTTTPAGSNSMGGLVLHSGVSDLMSDQSAALFDESIVYTARMSVVEPTAPPIINSILWAGSRIQLSGTGPAHDISASVTTVNNTLRNITADFSSLGATQVVADVYQNSNFVGRLALPTSTTTLEGFTSLAVVEVGANPSGAAGFSFTFAGTVTFTAPAGPGYDGNKILLRASSEDPGNVAQYTRVRHFSMGGSGGRFRSDALLDYERGDARTAYGSLDARHGAESHLRLGTYRDQEVISGGSGSADWDDNHRQDDEDGFIPPSYWTDGLTVEAKIVLKGSGRSYVGIWVNYIDPDLGVFSADEFVASGVYEAEGEYPVMISIPPTIPEEEEFYVTRVVRVRISDTPIGSGDGHSYLDTGEVEDHLVTIRRPLEDIMKFGLSHVALGEARLLDSTNGLLISNLGSSGQDGVRIELSRSQGWRASVTRQPDLAAGFTTVYSINIVGMTGGISNQSLATMRLERQGSNLLFSADFSALGASNYTATFYDSNGNLVNNTRPFQNLEVVPLYPDCPDGYIPDCEWVSFIDSATGAMHVGFLLCRGCLRFPDDTRFPGEGPVLVILTPVAPVRTVQHISAVEIRGGSTAPSISNSILLTSEATRHLDHWQRAVGGAMLDTVDANGTPTLRVSNLGSSGEDGFEVFAGGNDIWDNFEQVSLAGRIVQSWRNDMPLFTSTNSHVRWTVTGRISNRMLRDLGDLTFFNQGQGDLGFNARFDGIGATQAVVEVFDGPALVGSFTTPVGLVGSVSSTARVSRVGAQLVDGIIWQLKWDTRSAVRLSAGPSLMGDRLRIIALNPTTTVEGLHSLITRGANVESFALSGFNTTEPQRPRLGTPRLLPDGRVTLRLSIEPDVAYQLETSPSVNGPWTSLGQVIGTDGLNETEVEDTVLRISNRVRLFRVRIR